MATTKFFLRSKGNECKIQVQFSISRTSKFRTSTGLIINSDNWSDKTSLPIQKNTDLKNLHTELKNLSNKIENQYNVDYPKGLIFSTEWLKNTITKNFNRIDEFNDNAVFLNYLSQFKELRKLDSRTTKSTNQKFIQLTNKFTAFEKFKKKKFRVDEIDKKVMLDFKNFLVDNYKLMDSTALTSLRNIKTVLLDAQSNGAKISHQISGFSIENPTSLKVFLSFAEIEKIKNATIVGDNLQFARDWLVIGCYTGQRVSDLLRMTKEMIYTKTNSKGKKFEVLDLTQVKTGAEVTIPLHDEVIEILKKYNGNFPPTFGKSKDSNFVLFNRLIKKVAELSGLNAIVKGKFFNDEIKRNEIVETEKHKLVSSHICRRSFATNFYGDNRFTTPQIMAITGHKTESVFLTYIGKTSSDHALKTAETFAEIKSQKIAN